MPPLNVAGNPSGGNVVQTMNVQWTAKNVNAAAGSRTAINQNLELGYVLALDPYGHDTVSSLNGLTLPNYTQPQTSHLFSRKGIVSRLTDANVNTIPNSAAPTQRKGGEVEITINGRVLAWVGPNVARGSKVGCANGSSILTAVSGAGTANSESWASVGVTVGDSPNDGNNHLIEVDIFPN